jgi:hypothetical protein
VNSRRLLGVLLLCAASSAAAEEIEWKFTPTLYRTTNEASAFDLNLRGELDAHRAWVGFYRRGNEFQQLRAGYEYSAQLPFGRLLPSLQVASRGFLGASVNAELGSEKYFGLLGFGRTNLRPYFNLNFDPNDAITLGAGTRALGNTTVMLFQVRDDRLGTDQRVTHLTARNTRRVAGQRWSVDLFHREGRETPESEKVRGTGIAVGYDYHQYFARVAYDPHVNFSPNTMLRLAIGLRF